ncbi:receptor-like protein EIX2 [Cornus florida]|uniref:receptor-like protein EIX2 n=1 Tax=Cornus florida TaxID=4283 RepID=UPI002896D937|nr:receptor-like protein EIX2 [Cornus florida]
MYFIEFLCLGSVEYIMGGSLPNVQCMESEQEALLRFTEGLVDRSDRLSSWVVEEEADCCKWRGVETWILTISVELFPHSCANLSSIPHDIGSMKLLEQLDLSRNELSCSIPTSISDLTSLGFLDVSQNNLSGKIPSSVQQFGKASFMGIPNLCGLPTAKDCFLSNAIYDYDDAFCRG